MADISDKCGSRITITLPGGEQFDIDIPDLGDLLDEEIAEPLEPEEPDSPRGEIWEEISRKTDTINVSGVRISRIRSVRMRKNNGAIVELRFRGNI